MGMMSLNPNGLKSLGLLGLSRVKALTPYSEFKLGIGWADPR